MNALTKPAGSGLAISLSAVAICVGAAWSLSTPAQAATYWCNDGTAVSDSRNCKIHGGYTPIARHNPNAGAVPGIFDRGFAGNLSASKTRRPASDDPCIFDRWGILTPDAPGCRLAAGQEPACLKSGGALAKAGAGKFCISRRPRAPK